MKKINYALLICLFLSSTFLSASKRLNVVVEPDYEELDRSDRSKEEFMGYQYIHIQRESDGTKIEFWIDPFEDEVELDFTFSQPVPVSDAKGESKPYKYAQDEVSFQDKNVQGQDTMTKDGALDEQEDTKTKQRLVSYSIEDYLHHYENAQALYYAKKYNGALISIKKAIGLNREVAQGYKLQGTILYTLKRYDEALDAWKKSLQLNPKLNDVKESIKSLEGQFK